MKIERQSGEQIVINHHIYFWNGETFVKPSKLKKQLKAAEKLLKKQSSKFQWQTEGRISGTISASTWREYFDERGIEPVGLREQIRQENVIEAPDVDYSELARPRGWSGTIRQMTAEEIQARYGHPITPEEAIPQPTSQGVEANQTTEEMYLELYNNEAIAHVTMFPTGSTEFRLPSGRIIMLSEGAMERYRTWVTNHVREGEMQRRMNDAVNPRTRLYMDENLLREMREYQRTLESRMAQALYGTQPNGNNN